jgi:serine/threonine protein kinase
MSSLLGQSLGRYHILEQIGEGGMAIVYKAYDTRLEANVAVKVIRTENLAPSILENALIRFEREAKSLAKLTHPNIVKVLDYGEYEGKPYLVMPYLPGGTLKQKLHGIPMPYQEAASILIPIARALAYAHQQGLVHRDVKPSNVLITQSGDPMLTDFGIAKILGEEVALDLTGTSATIGTPEYMAPEQATSKSVDHRADIYALGIVLFEMVTGRRPYQADTPMAVLIKQISEPLPRPKTFAPDLPDAVENILLKALAKTPDDRYQNMNDFAAALEQMARGDVTPAMKKVASPPATLTDYLPSPARTRDTTSLLTQRVSRQFEQSPVPKSSAGQRWLAFGVGGIGMLIAGICLIAVVVIILRGISAPATPAPYVQSTAHRGGLSHGGATGRGLSYSRTTSGCLPHHSTAGYHCSHRRCSHRHQHSFLSRCKISNPYSTQTRRKDLYKNGTSDRSRRYKPICERKIFTVHRDLCSYYRRPHMLRRFLVVEN